MKVLVIDNDASVREGMTVQLKKFCPNVEQINTAEGVASGIEAINRINPDLVFLDVEMDDGTGFDLIKRLGVYNFQLVFITAYNQYAINAFKFSALDFLLKPIDPTDLLVSINKANTQIKNKNLEKQVKLLEESLQQLHAVNNKEKRIALNDGSIIHYLKVSDIIYCKAEGSYTIFYLSNASKIMVSKLLKEYEDLFMDLGFIRTHHSYLINSSKILIFDKKDGGQLVLEENHVVPVSTRKKEQVLELLSKM